VNEPISLDARRAARRATKPPTTEESLRIAEQNREHDRQALERGLAIPPSKGWEETASWVDEGTWLRILSEYEGEARAELERIRPPAAALAHLMRAHATNPLLHRSKP